MVKAKCEAITVALGQEKQLMYLLIEVCLLYRSTKRQNKKCFCDMAISIIEMISLNK